MGKDVAKSVSMASMSRELVAILRMFIGFFVVFVMVLSHVKFRAMWVKNRAYRVNPSISWYFSPVVAGFIKVMRRTIITRSMMSLRMIFRGRGIIVNFVFSSRWLRASR